MKPERTHMKCCIGCRHYETCYRWDFCKRVVCGKWRLQWAIARLKKAMGGGWDVPL